MKGEGLLFAALAGRSANIPLHMRSTAEAFTEVLIERHTRLCRPKRRSYKTVTDADIRECRISYGALCEEARVGLPRGSGTFLAEVHRVCEKNHWPPLNALAVNAKKGRPGDNYPGKDWEREIRECIAFASYPSIQSAAWK